LRAFGPKTPSCSSADHGRLFGELFESKGGNFYDIDPLLFSPAVVTFVNLDSGNSFRFGQTSPELLRRSFGL
ncbi:MAG: methenyltetrahydromethanopterin cyclohydrolase, partial [Planctomycetales bacterium]